VIAAWASVIGSALQLVVQLPMVFTLLEHFRPVLETASANVRTVITNFGPVFVGRGVVQISGYIDSAIASLLGMGALAALTNAQALYMLPVSLFGMSVSAAELPAMSSATGGTEEVAEYLRSRLDAGLRRIAFLVVPSAMAFLALGDVLAAALFQSGRFTHEDSVYVWSILAGSAVGLLASTLGRLYSSTYYALRDTRTPLRYAVVRVLLTGVLGFLFAIPLPRLLGIDVRWGAGGLTASAGISAWVEFTLLRRTLNARIGRTGLSASLVSRLWLAAAMAAAAAWGVRILVGPRASIVLALLTLIPYGAVYFAVTAGLGVPEVRTAFGRVMRRFRA
jgi:putative peptidoglycan lipid II flippase